MGEAVLSLPLFLSACLHDGGFIINTLIVVLKVEVDEL